MFSLRVVATDYYLSNPVANFDPCHSTFRGSHIQSVPVIRIFGTTVLGQKCCLHVHGAFPYILIPYDGSETLGRLPYILASALDKAINISLGQSDSFKQHVFKVVPVSGIPFYGFHSQEHLFLKLFLYNPQTVKKAVTLLNNGLILGKPFQTFESHVPYIQQFLMDYNLHGMNCIELDSCKFRRQTGITDKSEEKIRSTQKSAYSLPASSDASFSIETCTKYWNPSEISEEHLMPPEVEKTSSCELEVDSKVSNIINAKNIKSNVAANPGLSYIWEDERARTDFSSSKEETLLPSSSPPRSNVEKSESEEKHRALLNLKLLKLDTLKRHEIISENLPHMKTPLNSSFLPAIASLDETLQEEEMDADNSQSLKEMGEATVDEITISSLSQQADSTITMDSQDNELLCILLKLANGSQTEEDPNTSHLLPNGHSSGLGENNINYPESDDEESILMSQPIDSLLTSGSSFPLDNPSNTGNEDIARIGNQISQLDGPILDTLLAAQMRMDCYARLPPSKYSNHSVGISNCKYTTAGVNCSMSTNAVLNLYSPFRDVSSRKIAQQTTHQDISDGRQPASAIRFSEFVGGIPQFDGGNDLYPKHRYSNSSHQKNRSDCDQSGNKSNKHNKASSEAHLSKKSHSKSAYSCDARARTEHRKCSKKYTQSKAVGKESSDTDLSSRKRSKLTEPTSPQNTYLEVFGIPDKRGSSINLERNQHSKAEKASKSKKALGGTELVHSKCSWPSQRNKESTSNHEKAQKKLASPEPLVFDCEKDKNNCMPSKDRTKISSLYSDVFDADYSCPQTPGGFLLMESPSINETNNMGQFSKGLCNNKKTTQFDHGQSSVSSNNKTSVVRSTLQSLPKNRKRGATAKKKEDRSTKMKRLFGSPSPTVDSSSSSSDSSDSSSSSSDELLSSLDMPKTPGRYETEESDLILPVNENKQLAQKMPLPPLTFDVVSDTTFFPGTDFSFDRPPTPGKLPSFGIFDELDATMSDVQFSNEAPKDPLDSTKKVAKVTNSPIFNQQFSDISLSESESDFLVDKPSQRQTKKSSKSPKRKAKRRLEEMDNLPSKVGKYVDNYPPTYMLTKGVSNKESNPSCAASKKNSLLKSKSKVENNQQRCQKEIARATLEFPLASDIETPNTESKSPKHSFIPKARTERSISELSDFSIPAPLSPIPPTPIRLIRGEEFSIESSGFNVPDPVSPFPVTPMRRGSYSGSRQNRSTTQMEEFTFPEIQTMISPIPNTPAGNEPMDAALSTALMDCANIQPLISPLPQTPVQQREYELSAVQTGADSYCLTAIPVPMASPIPELPSRTVRTISTFSLGSPLYDPITPIASEINTDCESVGDPMMGEQGPSDDLDEGYGFCQVYKDEQDKAIEAICPPAEPETAVETYEPEFMENRHEERDYILSTQLHLRSNDLSSDGGSDQEDNCSPDPESSELANLQFDADTALKPSIVESSMNIDASKEDANGFDASQTAGNLLSDGSVSSPVLPKFNSTTCTMFEVPLPNVDACKNFDSAVDPLPNDQLICNKTLPSIRVEYDKSLISSSENFMPAGNTEHVLTSNEQPTVYTSQHSTEPSGLNLCDAKYNDTQKEHLLDVHDDHSNVSSQVESLSTPLLSGSNQFTTAGDILPFSEFQQAFIPQIAQTSLLKENVSELVPNAIAGPNLIASEDGLQQNVSQNFLDAAGVIQTSMPLMFGNIGTNTVHQNLVAGNNQSNPPIISNHGIISSNMDFSLAKQGTENILPNITNTNVSTSISNPIMKYHKNIPTDEPPILALNNPATTPVSSKCIPVPNYASITNKGLQEKQTPPFSFAQEGFVTAPTERNITVHFPESSIIIPPLQQPQTFVPSTIISNAIFPPDKLASMNNVTSNICAPQMTANLAMPQYPELMMADAMQKSSYANVTQMKTTPINTNIFPLPTSLIVDNISPFDGRSGTMQQPGKLGSQCSITPGPPFTSTPVRGSKAKETGVPSLEPINVQPSTSSAITFETIMASPHPASSVQWADKYPVIRTKTPSELSSSKGNRNSFMEKSMEMLSPRGLQVINDYSSDKSFNASSMTRGGEILLKTPTHQKKSSPCITPKQDLIYEQKLADYFEPVVSQMRMINDKSTPPKGRLQSLLEADPHVDIRRLHETGNLSHHNLLQQPMPSQCNLIPWAVDTNKVINSPVMVKNLPTGQNILSKGPGNPHAFSNQSPFKLSHPSKRMNNAVVRNVSPFFEAHTELQQLIQEKTIPEMQLAGGGEKSSYAISNKCLNPQVRTLVSSSYPNASNSTSTWINGQSHTGAVPNQYLKSCIQNNPYAATIKTPKIVWPSKMKSIEEKNIINSHHPFFSARPSFKSQQHLSEEQNFSVHNIASVSGMDLSAGHQADHILATSASVNPPRSGCLPSSSLHAQNVEPEKHVNPALSSINFLHKAKLGHESKMSAFMRDQVPCESNQIERELSSFDLHPTDILELDKSFSSPMGNIYDQQLPTPAGHIRVIRDSPLPMNKISEAQNYNVQEFSNSGSTATALAPSPAGTQTSPLSLVLRPTRLNAKVQGENMNEKYSPQPNRSPVKMTVPISGHGSAKDSTRPLRKRSITSEKLMSLGSFPCQDSLQTPTHMATDCELTPLNTPGIANSYSGFNMSRIESVPFMNWVGNNENIEYAKHGPYKVKDTDKLNQINRSHLLGYHKPIPIKAHIDPISQAAVVGNSSLNEGQVEQMSACNIGFNDNTFVGPISAHKFQNKSSRAIDRPWIPSNTPHDIEHIPLSLVWNAESHPAGPMKYNKPTSIIENNVLEKQLYVEKSVSSVISNESDSPINVVDDSPKAEPVKKSTAHVSEDTATSLKGYEPIFMGNVDYNRSYAFPDHLPSYGMGSKLNSFSETPYMNNFIAPNYNRPIEKGLLHTSINYSALADKHPECSKENPYPPDYPMSDRALHPSKEAAHLPACNGITDKQSDIDTDTNDCQLEYSGKIRKFYKKHRNSFDSTRPELTTPAVVNNDVIAEDGFNGKPNLPMETFPSVSWQPNEHIAEKTDDHPSMLSSHHKDAGDSSYTTTRCESDKSLSDYSSVITESESIIPPSDLPLSKSHIPLTQDGIVTKSIPDKDLDRHPVSSCQIYESDNESMSELHDSCIAGRHSSSSSECNDEIPSASPQLLQNTKISDVCSQDQPLSPATAPMEKDAETSFGLNANLESGLTSQTNIPAINCEDKASDVNNVKEISPKKSISELLSHGDVSFCHLIDEEDISGQGVVANTDNGMSQINKAKEAVPKSPEQTNSQTEIGENDSASCSHPRECDNIVLMDHISQASSDVVTGVETNTDLICTASAQPNHSTDLPLLSTTAGNSNKPPILTKAYRKAFPEDFESCNLKNNLTKKRRGRPKKHIVPKLNKAKYNSPIKKSLLKRQVVVPHEENIVHKPVECMPSFSARQRRSGAKKSYTEFFSVDVMPKKDLNPNFVVPSAVPKKHRGRPRKGQENNDTSDCPHGLLAEGPSSKSLPPREIHKEGHSLSKKDGTPTKAVSGDQSNNIDPSCSQPEIANQQTKALSPNLSSNQHAIHNQEPIGTSPNLTIMQKDSLKITIKKSLLNLQQKEDNPPEMAPPELCEKEDTNDDSHIIPPIINPNDPLGIDSERDPIGAKRTVKITLNSNEGRPQKKFKKALADRVYSDMTPNTGWLPTQNISLYTPIHRITYNGPGTTPAAFNDIGLKLRLKKKPPMSNVCEAPKDITPLKSAEISTETLQQNTDKVNEAIGTDEKQKPLIPSLIIKKTNQNEFSSMMKEDNGSLLKPTWDMPSVTQSTNSPDFVRPASPIQRKVISDKIMASENVPSIVTQPTKLPDVVKPSYPILKIKFGSNSTSNDKEASQANSSKPMAVKKSLSDLHRFRKVPDATPVRMPLKIKLKTCQQKTKILQPSIVNGQDQKSCSNNIPKGKSPVRNSPPKKSSDPAVTKDLPESSAGSSEANLMSISSKLDSLETTLNGIFGSPTKQADSIESKLTDIMGSPLKRPEIMTHQQPLDDNELSAILNQRVEKENANEGYLDNTMSSENVVEPLQANSPDPFPLDLSISSAKPDEKLKTPPKVILSNLTNEIIEKYKAPSAKVPKTLTPCVRQKKGPHINKAQTCKKVSIVDSVNSPKVNKVTAINKRKMPSDCDLGNTNKKSKVGSLGEKSLLKPSNPKKNFMNKYVRSQKGKKSNEKENVKLTTTSSELQHATLSVTNEVDMKSFSPPPGKAASRRRKSNNAHLKEMLCVLPQNFAKKLPHREEKNILDSVVDTVIEIPNDDPPELQSLHLRGRCKATAGPSKQGFTNDKPNSTTSNEGDPYAFNDSDFTDNLTGSENCSEKKTNQCNASESSCKTMGKPKRRGARTRQSKNRDVLEEEHGSPIEVIEICESDTNYTTPHVVECDPLAVVSENDGATGCKQVSVVNKTPEHEKTEVKKKTTNRNKVDLSNKLDNVSEPYVIVEPLIHALETPGVCGEEQLLNKIGNVTKKSFSSALRESNRSEVRLSRSIVACKQKVKSNRSSTPAKSKYVKSLTKKASHERSNRVQKRNALKNSAPTLQLSEDGQTAPQSATDTGNVPIIDTKEETPEKLVALQKLGGLGNRKTRSANTGKKTIKNIAKLKPPNSSKKIKISQTLWLPRVRTRRANANVKSYSLRMRNVNMNNLENVIENVSVGSVDQTKANGSKLTKDPRTPDLSQLLASSPNKVTIIQPNDKDDPLCISNDTKLSKRTSINDKRLNSALKDTAVPIENISYPNRQKQVISVEVAASDVTPLTIPASSDIGDKQASAPCSMKGNLIPIYGRHEICLANDKADFTNNLGKGNRLPSPITENRLVKRSDENCPIISPAEKETSNICNKYSKIPEISNKEGPSLKCSERDQLMNARDFNLQKFRTVNLKTHPTEPELLKNYEKFESDIFYQESVTEIESTENIAAASFIDLQPSEGNDTSESTDSTDDITGNNTPINPDIIPKSDANKNISINDNLSKDEVNVISPTLSATHLDNDVNCDKNSNAGAAESMTENSTNEQQKCDSIKTEAENINSTTNSEDCNKTEELTIPTNLSKELETIINKPRIRKLPTDVCINDIASSCTDSPPNDSSEKANSVRTPDISDDVLLPKAPESSITSSVEMTAGAASINVGTGNSENEVATTATDPSGTARGYDDITTAKIQNKNCTNKIVSILTDISQNDDNTNITFSNSTGKSPTGASDTNDTLLKGNTTNKSAENCIDKLKESGDLKNGAIKVDNATSNDVTCIEVREGPIMPAQDCVKSQEKLDSSIKNIVNHCQQQILPVASNKCDPVPNHITRSVSDEDKLGGSESDNNDDGSPFTSSPEINASLGKTALPCDTTSTKFDNAEKGRDLDNATMMKTLQPSKSDGAEKDLVPDNATPIKTLPSTKSDDTEKYIEPDNATLIKASSSTKSDEADTTLMKALPSIKSNTEKDLKLTDTATLIEVLQPAKSDTEKDIESDNVTPIKTLPSTKSDDTEKYIEVDTATLMKTLQSDEADTATLTKTVPSIKSDTDKDLKLTDTATLIESLQPAKSDTEKDLEPVNVALIKTLPSTKSDDAEKYIKADTATLMKTLQSTKSDEADTATLMKTLQSTKSDEADRATLMKTLQSTKSDEADTATLMKTLPSIKCDIEKDLKHTDTATLIESLQPAKSDTEKFLEPDNATLMNTLLSTKSNGAEKYLEPDNASLVKLPATDQSQSFSTETDNIPARINEGKNSISVVEAPNQPIAPRTMIARHKSSGDKNKLPKCTENGIKTVHQHGSMFISAKNKLASKPFAVSKLAKDKTAYCHNTKSSGDYKTSTAKVSQSADKSKTAKPHIKGMKDTTTESAKVAPHLSKKKGKGLPLYKIINNIAKEICQKIDPPKKQLSIFTDIRSSVVTGQLDSSMKNRHNKRNTVSNSKQKPSSHGKHAVSAETTRRKEKCSGTNSSKSIPKGISCMKAEKFESGKRSRSPNLQKETAQRMSKKTKHRDIKALEKTSSCSLRLNNIFGDKESPIVKKASGTTKESRIFGESTLRIGKPVEAANRKKNNNNSRDNVKRKRSSSTLINMEVEEYCPLPVSSKSIAIADYIPTSICNTRPHDDSGHVEGYIPKPLAQNSFLPSTITSSISANANQPMISASKRRAFLPIPNKVNPYRPECTVNINKKSKIAFKLKGKDNVHGNGNLIGLNKEQKCLTKSDKERQEKSIMYPKNHSKEIYNTMHKSDLNKKSQKSKTDLRETPKKTGLKENVPKSKIDLKENAQKSKIDFKETAQKSETDLEENAHKSKMDLKKNAHKSKIDLKENAQKSKIELKENAQKSKIELKENAKKSKIKLKENAQKSKIGLKESAQNQKRGPTQTRHIPSIHESKEKFQTNRKHRSLHKYTKSDPKEHRTTKYRKEHNEKYKSDPKTDKGETKNDPIVLQYALQPPPVQDVVSLDNPAEMNTMSNIYVNGSRTKFDLTSLTDLEDFEGKFQSRRTKPSTPISPRLTVKGKLPSRETGNSNGNKLPCNDQEESVKADGKEKSTLALCEAKL